MDHATDDTSLGNVPELEALHPPAIAHMIT